MQIPKPSRRGQGELAAILAAHIFYRSIADWALLHISVFMCAATSACRKAVGLVPGGSSHVMSISVSSTKSMRLPRL